MKRKNQFERTDRDITNAVFALLDQKPFEKITVQDILDEAMINRTTFYQHFPDKYAVLERLQEHYMKEITEKLDDVMQNSTADFEKIGRVIVDYMSEHRRKMKRLLAIHSENLDLEKHLQDLFIRYVGKSASHLTQLEKEMLADLSVRFFIYFLNNDLDARNFAPTFLKTYLHISAFFFRIDNVPDVDKKFLNFVGSLYSEQNKERHPS